MGAPAVPGVGRLDGLRLGEALGAWYERRGRHDLPWRHHRDRWPVLVSEVMLQQTQVPRVLTAWPAFIARFPTAEACAAAEPGEVIRSWGRLGYPRRARRLWEAAVIVARDGWPEPLTVLPGVGRYTAGAIRAQADDADVAACDVNIRRVVERVHGGRLGPVAAETAAVAVAAPLRGRDRLLALMDVGATLCRPRDPRCGECPLAAGCTSRGPHAEEGRTSRPAPYAGSFRQRRGDVLAVLRDHAAHDVAVLDADALASLVTDGLAVVTDDGRARLP
jgi:A/G-specific adenine glycosylase